MMIHPAGQTSAMQELIENTWFRLGAGITLIAALSGCQSIQSAPGLPGLGASRAERGIVKQAKNDPFPSPDQVGLKTEP
jgi:hypothetical protein